MAYCIPIKCAIPSKVKVHSYIQERGRHRLIKIAFLIILGTATKFDVFGPTIARMDPEDVSENLAQKLDKNGSRIISQATGSVLFAPKLFKGRSDRPMISQRRETIPRLYRNQ